MTGHVAGSFPEVQRSEFWEALAVRVKALFPLAAADWDLHAEYVEQGVYSVRLALENPELAEGPVELENGELAEEPPLTPEEEEALTTLF